MTRSGDPARPLVWLGRAVDGVLLVVIAIGLCSVLLGRVLPAIGHPVFVVAGPSMTPAIPVGAAVILDQVPTTAVAVGDVVSLQNGASRAVFTHRIIRIAERDGSTWVETQGDANAAPDPSLTPATSILGRVGLTVPYAGFALALLSTIPGLVLVLSAGATLLVLGWWIDGLIDAQRRRRRATAAPPPLPVPHPPVPAWSGPAPPARAPWRLPLPPARPPRPTGATGATTSTRPHGIRHRPHRPDRSGPTPPTGPGSTSTASATR